MILVTGARGMLGRDLLAVFGGDARGFSHGELDITSPAAVEETLLSLRPGVIVNAAAYTDVDGCETNRELAFRVNGEGVKNLAAAAERIGAKLVQISTDYVFDGAKGEEYTEEDPVNPLNVYGCSKLAGEENARMARDHLIVRTQWLYGLNGKNFVETMLRLAGERESLRVVDDQTGSPTWTQDLASAVKALIAKDCRGTYHAVNTGSCTWNGFARAIFEESGLRVRVEPVSSAEFGRPAVRPSYSVLDCGRLAADTGRRPEGWREALRRYLKIRGEKDGKR